MNGRSLKRHQTQRGCLEDRRLERETHYTGTVVTEVQIRIEVGVGGSLWTMDNVLSRSIYQTRGAMK